MAAPHEKADASSPVHQLAIDPPAAQIERQLEDRIGLCLSGGGYRAMLFHLGALWRLNEAGILRHVARISSVSGGAITAGVLALNWQRLKFNDNHSAENFQEIVVEPVRRLAGKTIDVWAVIVGLLPWTSAGQRIAAAYRRVLFGDATLQDLPNEPQFVINATNVQSGVLWRFMKPYMADYRVGIVERPPIPLAIAVSASSAFPPVLSPVVMRLNETDFKPGSGKDLQRPPFTTRAVLTDGGVYDNLGLETIWKKYRSVLVSDGGGQYEPEGRPRRNWASHGKRVTELVDSQVRSLRKRQTIESYVNGIRAGTYWGIRSNITDYSLADPLPCDFSKTQQLADVPTRLKRMSGQLQERLINWGYAVCDAALRRHFRPELPRPQGFPYPRAGV